MYCNTVILYPLIKACIPTVALKEQLQEAIKEELDKGSIEGYRKRLLC
jgi:hypothetical protein